MLELLRLVFSGFAFFGIIASAVGAATRTCTVSPLGNGQDDTDQVTDAISRCGKNGHVTLQSGTFNITRKMTWELENSQVDLFGVLNFEPNIQFWLEPNNTYRVVFIQSQASWFVLTGKNFVVDAHNQGGIDGNGQPWWEYFASHTREDGDGRPLSLTLFEAENAVIRNFHIQSPPFWCNCVSSSQNVVYDGMTCNATNTNSTFFGRNIVQNTDGIDTYRSNNITLQNWDVSTGDDCIAIKGNSTNLRIKDITCHGGGGIAFGSLGQYSNLTDIVDNVMIEDVHIIRPNSSIQPNTAWGLYFKSWDGSINGVPPTGGGGGNGSVSNVVARRFSISGASEGVGMYQTNDALPGDIPSFFQFKNVTVEDWSGYVDGDQVINVNCSVNAPCPGLKFKNINLTVTPGDTPVFTCENAPGLTSTCNSTSAS